MSNRPFNALSQQRVHFKRRKDAQPRAQTNQILRHKVVFRENKVLGWLNQKLAIKMEIGISLKFNAVDIANPSRRIRTLNDNLRSIQPEYRPNLLR